MNGFQVMSRLCETCIYRKSWQGTPVEELEDQVRDRWIGFSGYRVCHSQKRGRKACCRGFWNKHKWEFAAGQIAQRLKLVEFVEPS
jgi:hypothetical protein